MITISALCKFKHMTFLRVRVGRKILLNLHKVEMVQ
jgi:hypothetical protein